MRSQRIRSKPTTVKSARLRSARVLKGIGDVEVPRLTPAHVDRFIANRRRQGAKASTINCDLRILRALLRHAVDGGVIEKLPCKIKMLRAPNRRTIEPFTPEEINRVLAVAEDRVRVLLVIAGSAGLRLDECLHLQWRDINFKRCVIHVREKRYCFRDRRGQVVDRHWSPKSHQARSVFITAEAADELRRFRMAQQWSAAEDWVFQSRRPRQRWTAPHKAIRRAFEEAGLYEPGKGTHALRHTVATRMLQNGIDLETVRDVLGHKDISTTALYLHAVDERKRAAADAVGLIGGR